LPIFFFFFANPFQNTYSEIKKAAISGCFNLNYFQ